MKLLTYFLLVASALQSKAFAVDLIVDYVPQRQEAAVALGSTSEKDPEPGPLTAAQFHRFSAGLGYRQRTGSVPGGGAFATIRDRYYSAHGMSNDYSDSMPLQFMDLAANFNVFNKDQGAEDKSTEISAKLDYFVGYSFIRDQEKAGFFLGGNLHVQTSAGWHTNYKSEWRAAIGPETGFHVSTDNVVATLAGSVMLGGESCTVGLPNGAEFKFGSGMIGFARIARLLISDKFYMNVFYIEYPKDRDTDNNNRTNAAKSLNTTLFWDIGKRISLSANCTMNQMDANIKKTTDQGVALPDENHSLQNNQFQIGIIQRF